MNLQLCIPYQSCPYNCPFCIAKGHSHGYNFGNLYANDKNRYFELLKDTLKTLEPKSSVILTGDTEPTLNMPFLKEVIKVIRKTRKDLKIELQTRNYCFKGGLDIDILAYSIVNSRAYLHCGEFYKLPKPKINRIVILLTDEFEFLDKTNFNSFGYDQVTFKSLQYGESDTINEWIKEHKMDYSKEFHFRNYSQIGVSFKYDNNCQNADGRYIIFRSDGKVYNSWEERRK